MRLSKNNIVFYKSYFFSIVFLFINWILFRINKNNIQNEKPIIILSGHLFDGNLKAFYDYYKSEKYQDYEIYYMTLDERIYNRLSKKYGNTILSLQSFVDVKKLFSADCLMTSHGILIPMFKYFFPKTKLIDVWHGIPFLQYNKSQLIEMYDYSAIFVSSLEMKKKYKIAFNFNEQNLIVTGYSRFDRLINRNYSSEVIKNELNLSGYKKIILYAPTWQKDRNKYKVPFNIYSEKFLEKINKIFSQHNSAFVMRMHQNSQSETNIKDSYNNIFDISQFSYPETEKILSITDLLISDWSSIIIDYCILDKPILIMDTPMPSNWISKKTWINRGGYFVSDYESLKDYLIKVFNNELIPSKEQIIMKESIFNDQILDGNSCSRYHDELKKVLSIN